MTFKEILACIVWMVLLAGAERALGYEAPSKPISGTRDLLCVAVEYTDGAGCDLQSCKNAADTVAAFYKDNSRGKLVMRPKAVAFKPGMPKAQWQQVETMIKAKFKADFYIVPNLWRGGVSNAGGKIAHLTGMSSARHEVGHLIGLGHSGSYRNGVYDQYGDGTSIMSKFSAATISPSQYYFLGWLPKEEIIYYNPSVKTYILKRINDYSAKGLSVVIIDPKYLSAGGDGRPGFIAHPIKCEKLPCASYYLQNGGGSSKIATFGNEYSDPKNGLKITVTNRDDGRTTVKIETAKVDVQ